MFDTENEQPRHLPGSLEPPHPSTTILDPRVTEARQREALGAWLRFHSALALKPQRAIECLARSSDPAIALRFARQSTLLGAEKIEASIDALARHRYLALPWGSPLYPGQLAALTDPPPLLFCAGDPRLLMLPAVAIVGARAATAPALEMARQTARAVASAGLVVISGLARGVDAAAHRGALEAGGLTVAVQACGPDRVYPASHIGLAWEIRESGALLTEMPLGSPPLPPYFPLRNRIISGLSKLVVVIEARERSGSLITARHALDQGRQVMAMPGAITNPASRGTNRLIQDGAAPLLEPADVLVELGLYLPEASERVGHEIRTQPARMSRNLRAILELIEREPLSRDELGRRLGKQPRQLALELVDLELDGWIKEDRDGRIQPLPSNAGGRFGRDP